MKLPRLNRSGFVVAGLLLSALVARAEPTATEFNTLGARDRRAGHFDAAIADYTKAIELNPQYAVAYQNRAGARLFVDDYAGALADASKAIALQPDFASAYNTRGNVRRAMGDFTGARADFTK